MPQTTYRDGNQLAGVPGLSYDGENRELKGYANKDPQAKKKVTVTVDSAVNDTDYTITVKETDFTITSDASNATTEGIRDKLIAAIKSEALVYNRVDVEVVDADTLRILSKLPGVGFKFSESDSNLSSNTEQSEATAAFVPFGRAVEREPDLQGEYARLVDDSNLTKKELAVTLPGSSDGLYELYLSVLGETHKASYSASGDNISTILGELQSDIDALEYVEAEVDSNPNPTELQIRSENAGFARFQILSVDGPEDASNKVNAEGTGLEKVFGLAYTDGDKLADTDFKGGYRPNQHMTVATQGRFFVDVEDTPSFGDTVHVRVAASGNNDQLGVFSGTAGDGLVPLENASFYKIYDTISVIELE